MQNCTSQYLAVVARETQEIVMLLVEHNALDQMSAAAVLVATPYRPTEQQFDQALAEARAFVTQFLTGGRS